MIVSVDENVYDIPVEIFNQIISLAVESKTSRYFIYCLVREGLHILAKDSTESESSFKKLLESYINQGFDVYFMIGDEFYVKHAG